VASGFSGAGGGALGFAPAVSSWYFGSAGQNTLGAFIREAQLDDFLYSWGGPQPKIRPLAITASAELPGSTHWDPAPVPVGSTPARPSTPAVVVQSEGTKLPGVALPSILSVIRNESEPPVTYVPPPIVLPGQTDPGREEFEEEETEVAHTWTHVGSQLLGAIFPDTVTQQSFVAGPGQIGPGAPAMPVPNVANGGANMQAYAGSCPPRKTRTLTIDCATGLEVKRKRRRRRALLTQGDMGVLFQIASLPNNANVRVALAGAIRR